MCGINGIFAYREGAPPVDEAELLRVREAMARRGPDGSGRWISPDRRLGLGHRRLSIIDLSDAGAQPMTSSDGRLQIVFNGEIYNHHALRRDLEAAGVVFRSSSDTEVLLHLYARHGAGMLERLRGMFAIAIWDSAARRLFLARDPFGIKPLYYADDGATFRWASQVRALRAGGALDSTRDPAGEAGFLLWGFVPEPFTLFRSIRALPAGTYLEVDARGAAEPRRFFDLASEFAAAAEDGSSSLERLGEVLQESVGRHLVSDVPVGVFLSAGIDSAVIATLAARVAGPELRCITLGFEEYRGGSNDETVLAAQFARKLGVRHAVDWLAKPAFHDELAGVLAAMDQPSIDGINTYFVARAAARQQLKVALSGLGGDELLLGYPSFRDVPRMVRAFGFATRLPGSIGRGMRVISAPLLGRFTSPKYAGLLEYGGRHEGAYLLRRGLFMPWELPAALGPEAAREGWERLRPLASLSETRHGIHSDAAIVSCLELAWYMRGQLLRDADWAGMAHSVEIRVPFVDVDVLRAAAPLAVSGALRAKRDFAALPAFDLPRAVLDRPKTGFQVPVLQWLARPGHRPQRHLRAWAKKVFHHFTAERSYLSLVTDAYGGRGGIALYGRDFLAAICSHPATGGVVAIPRLAPGPLEPMPPELQFETSSTSGKVRYAAAVAKALLSKKRFDMVVCGHINLLPIAFAAAKIARAPLLLVIYGIDAWSPRRQWLAKLLVRRADSIAAISETTLQRFQAWSKVPHQQCTILPNAIHLERYRDGPKNEALLERYGIRGRKVIMTLGRLSSTERYKGVDEVLQVMPRLVNGTQGVVYLVAGDGSDRPRLQAKARALGLGEHVVFTGYVDEREKADHYRLADAFVMPSRAEGFGFVFLEALACGTPVVGSRLDGGREALRDGLLGRLVDPGNSEELAEAICQSLAAPRGVPHGLEYFGFANFERRCHRLLEHALLH